MRQWTSLYVHICTLTPVFLLAPFTEVELLAQRLRMLYFDVYCQTALQKGCNTCYFHHQWWREQTTFKGMFHISHKALKTSRGDWQGPHPLCLHLNSRHPWTHKSKTASSSGRAEPEARAGWRPHRHAPLHPQPNISGPNCFLRVQGESAFGFQALDL